MVALGLLFLINSLQTYQSLKVLDTNASRSGTTTEILQLAGSTYFAIQNAELHLRDYMLRSTNQQLDAYIKAVNEVKIQITQLQALGTELPLQRSRFDKLLEMINSHDQALSDAIARHKETQVFEAKIGTTANELSFHATENDKQEAQVLSDIMSASRQSLTVLSDLINAIEKEELTHIQDILDESAQRRKQVSQAVLLANCLGMGLLLVIAMLTSRTSRQQAEYAKTLEDKVQERTQALELYAQELSNSNRELENFAFVASHDLQEPLRKIRTFGDRLKDGYSESLGDGKDYVERMQNAAMRMSKLIEDLLSFSRITTRRKPFEEVDLNDILAGVLDDLQFKIEETDAKITSDQLPTLIADPTQMSQLFLNLLANAMKFVAPDTRPVIEIRVKETELLISSGTVDEELSLPAVEIIVQDNGIGFDEQFLSKIFSAFQRLHHRDEYEGTGIGLAICRRIVERHGGTITAQSQSGSGATFFVELPLKQADTNELSHAELGLHSSSDMSFGNATSSGTST